MRTGGRASVRAGVHLRADGLKVAHDLVVLQIVKQVDLGLDGLQMSDGHVARRDLLDRAKVARLPVERAVHLAGAAAAELLAQLLRARDD